MASCCRACLFFVRACVGSPFHLRPRDLSSNFLTPCRRTCLDQLFTRWPPWTPPWSRSAVPGRGGLDGATFLAATSAFTRAFATVGSAGSEEDLEGHPVEPASQASQTEQASLASHACAAQSKWVGAVTPARQRREFIQQQRAQGFALQHCVRLWAQRPDVAERKRIKEEKSAKWRQRRLNKPEKKKRGKKCG